MRSKTINALSWEDFRTGERVVGIEGRKAELFLCLTDTCPVNCALWDVDSSQTHMEVISKLPNSGSGQRFLSKFIVDGTTNGSMY